jgi:hypothetical protein
MNLKKKEYPPPQKKEKAWRHILKTMSGPDEVKCTF